MRTFILIIFSMILIASCNNNNTQSENSNANPSSRHIEVLEVLQPGGYTYLFVSEGNKEYWIATDRFDTKVGDDFYFENGMEMKDFTSKELDRTFESILFVDKLSTVPILTKSPVNAAQNMSGKKPAQEMKNIVVEPAEGGITIAELYANRSKYQGQKVIVTGQVVKVNEAIMHRNWIHLQDGTKDGENFDLTLTTLDEVKVDDVVTFVGTVALDKDFGAGYTYELIVEDAVKL